MGCKLLQLRGWFGRKLVDPLCSKANQGGGVEEEEREKVNYWRIICRFEARFSKQKSNIIPDDEKQEVKV